MNDRDDEAPPVSNQSRLREKLKSDALARSLADAYDTAHTDEANRDALKKVVEHELDKMRQSIEHDKNQDS